MKAKGASLRIGIDLMGSDRSPEILLTAIREAVAEMSPGVTFHLFVTPDIQKKVPESNAIVAHAVTEVIEMDDDPLLAIRRKRDSSIVVGTQYLKEGKIDAFVSAGNTGALVASATLTLSRLPGTERPALLATLPSLTGSFVMIDVGGVLSVKPEHLVQFAHMGAAYQRCYHGVVKPKIGLLNIGVESKKGTPEIREAYRLLSNEDGSHPIEFVGNVEGREVFQGNVDVLVTDGFSGNVFLKTAEGVSSFIMEYIRGKGGGSLEEFRDHFNYDGYPGAIVCGVDGVVVKCHGEATPKALLNSIRGAVKLVENGLIEKLKDEF